jgi:hypothetical protein
VHYEGDALLDHCGRPFEPGALYEDDEGSVLMAGRGVVALLDDRDLLRFADVEGALQRIQRTEVPRRFGFVPEPQPG